MNISGLRDEEKDGTYPCECLYELVTFSMNSGINIDPDMNQFCCDTGKCKRLHKLKFRK